MNCVDEIEGERFRGEPDVGTVQPIPPLSCAVNERAETSQPD